MKRIVATVSLFSVLLIASFNSGCDQDVVGSDEDIKIQHVSFQIDTTYLSSSHMIAKGTITNTGTATIKPVWYVEGQFYTDGSFLIKLGGDQTSINYPLAKDQTTFWQLRFSSEIVNISIYPDFRVSDLRAVYKP